MRGGGGGAGEEDKKKIPPTKPPIIYVANGPSERKAMVFAISLKGC